MDIPPGIQLSMCILLDPRIYHQGLKYQSAFFLVQGYTTRVYQSAFFLVQGYTNRDSTIKVHSSWSRIYHQGFNNQSAFFWVHDIPPGIQLSKCILLGPMIHCRDSTIKVHSSGANDTLQGFNYQSAFFFWSETGWHEERSISKLLILRVST